MFVRFWAAYPRKEGKGAAEKAFDKHKPDEALLLLMLQAIARQQASDRWRKEGGQYIPMPTTWLNQKRWEDGGVDASILKTAPFAASSADRHGRHDVEEPA
jgi:hypothetical protein